MRLHKLLLLAAVGISPSDASDLPIHGVAPDDVGKFADPASFECSSGGSVPRVLVNDDFCDCADGSDEPGTAACAGETRGTSAGFYCANAGVAPRYIYHSRVGDGVCDCCDGSDEWQTGLCGDACGELVERQRQRLQERRKQMEAGIEIRRKALLGAGTPDTWRARIAETQEGLPAREAEIHGLRSAIDAAEAAFEAARPRLEAEAAAKAAEQSAQPAQPAKEAAQAAERKGDDSTEEQQVSEYAKWMESTASADGSSAEGSSTQFGIERKVVQHRHLSTIQVRSGDLIDFIEFYYTSGEPLITGGGDGNAQPSFELLGEGVVELRGGQGGLLDGLEFVTNTGRVSMKYGGGGGDKFSYKAAPNMQIVGLDRSDGNCGSITAVHECILVDPRSPEEKARDEARLALATLEASLQEAQAEIRELEARLQGDVKQDTRDAYSIIANKCASGHVDKYKYEICIYGDAKQGHTRLGSWQGWDTETKNVALFNDGERCFSGITRSARVTVECGERHEVLKAFEPSQCVYEATMTHPAACDESVFEMPAGDVRALRAHEFHEEL